jgi:hypothetical protein
MHEGPGYWPCLRPAYFGCGLYFGPAYFGCWLYFGPAYFGCWLYLGPAYFGCWLYLEPAYLKILELACKIHETSQAVRTFNQLGTY